MQNFLKWLHQEHGTMSLDFLKETDADEAIKLLVQHKGIGVKTAYIVLAFACKPRPLRRRHPCYIAPCNAWASWMKSAAKKKPTQSFAPSFPKTKPAHFM